MTRYINLSVLHVQVQTMLLSENTYQARRKLKETKVSQPYKYKNKDIKKKRRMHKKILPQRILLRWYDPRKILLSENFNAKFITKVDIVCR